MPPRPLQPLPLLCVLASAVAAGCATKTPPPDLPLPPRSRMEFDPEATVRAAVAERLVKEQRQLDTMLLLPAASLPSTRPATVQVPSPQLIPAPEPLREAGFTQGPSANPVEEALATVADANEHATRSPTPAGFLNAIHYYDFAPGMRYNAVAAAGYITSVRLRPGERLQSLSCSDTGGYEFDEVLEGSGPDATTLLLVKPKHAGTQSNWVITTDERTYYLDLYVNDKPNYQSAVAWNYPLDGLRVIGRRQDRQRLRFEKGDAGGLDMLAAARVPAGGGAPPATDPTPPAQAGDATGAAVGPLGMNLESMNFGYLVLYQSRGADGKTRDAPAPPWAPLRVFDDGRKTFVQFPPQARHYELPPLFALEHPDDATGELVNYRRAGDFLIVDGLVVAAELRAGDAPQQVVKIVRGKASDPSVQPVDLPLASGDATRTARAAEPTPQPTADAKPRVLAGYVYDDEEQK